jgi:hypothetical protein
MVLDKILIENKIDVFYHAIELMKEIIINYKNGGLNQNHLETLFDIQKDIINNISMIYENLYYLINGNNIEKNCKLNNEIVDVILNIDVNASKKLFNKNKIYSYQLFDILNSNKYYKYMNKNQNFYLLLFNSTIFLLREISQIISIEINELNKIFNEEFINKKYNILDKYSIYLAKIFNYFTIIYNKKAEDDFEKDNNIF